MAMLLCDNLKKKPGSSAQIKLWWGVISLTLNSIQVAVPAVK